MNKKKILCFDLDNTICKTIGSNYKNSKPKKKVLKIINKLYEEGYIIKIYTARYMGRNSDDKKKIKKSDKEFTTNQIKKWKLKFHKIIFGKPSFDIIFDDKSYNFNNKWLSYINDKFLTKSK
tara:strand:+ start:142 stop:507 length:366 start_codon:yes stop_codon:yes gene_type:complete